MSHEHPVVVERGGCATGVEDGRVLLQDGLELLQVAWVALQQQQDNVYMCTVNNVTFHCI